MRKGANGKRGPRQNLARARRIIALYRSGSRPMQIAGRVACSPPLVYKVLRRAKLWRTRPRRTPLVGAEIVIRRLRQAGFSQALIARLLGVSPVAVLKALRRAGPIRKGRAARNGPSARGAGQ